MTSASLMHEVAHSKLVLWDNPEGKDVEQVQDRETYMHPWVIHVGVWQKPPQYCKVINLQFK